MPTFATSAIRTSHRKRQLTADFVARITAKWRQRAPDFWWGDRLDVRFLVVDALRGLAGVRLLDVGCNAGVMLSEVPPTNRSFGLDAALTALKLAREITPSTPVVAGDMFTLPYRDASFEAVLYCGMLELAPDEQKEAAVREVARVLAPRGRLLLTTANRRYRLYRSGPSRRGVTLEQLRQLLAPHFEAVIQGFNPCPPFPYFLPNRVLARVPGVWPFLIALMERNIGARASRMFYVEAVRKS
jgi:SAM-dependent methyltransferase